MNVFLHPTLTPAVPRALRHAASLVLVLLLGAVLAVPGALAQHDHHAPPTPAEGGPGGPAESLDALTIPDVTLVNQEGEAVAFQELIAGRIVVINFIFTTCTTVCPPMGANFGQLQKQLGDALGSEVALISISVDPVVDTPERLKAWSQKFGARPGWTLLTGPKRDVDTLLRALEAFTADKTDHTPFLLLGKPDAGTWTRVHGFTPPAKIAELLAPWLAETTPTTTPAHHYFTDVSLVDHHGRTHRLYSDLVRGKVVVVGSFFGSCEVTCPVLMNTFARLQTWLGERLGQEVHLLALTVDPENDSPEALRAYAERLEAQPGWYFLTGEAPDIALALHKFGQYVEARESHTNLFIIGNEPTGLWKKAFGLAQAEAIIEILEGVLDDEG